MKERPILFSAPMVRAILGGSKTQTRRIVNGVKHFPEFGSAVGMVGGAWRYGSPAGLGLAERGDCWSVTLDADHLKRMCAQEAYGWGAGAGCPYGPPGGRLWVRETWQGPLLEQFEVDADSRWMSPLRIHQYQNPAHCRYAADGGGAPEFLDADDNLQCRWRPSIHMPRWASRITLEITGVRVERLQDISIQDAKAEGAWGPDDSIVDKVATYFGIDVLAANPRLAFQMLWESINGPDSWQANPWVWAIDFKRLEQPA